MRVVYCEFNDCKFNCDRYCMLDYIQLDNNAKCLSNTITYKNALKRKILSNSDLELLNISKGM